MKKLFAVLLVGLFSMTYVPKVDAQAVEVALASIALVTLVIDEVSDGCNNLREEGRLQNRLKNDICGPVACISLRPTC